MHVFIVYAHPSDNSFTRFAKDKFIEGLKEKGHTFDISDLYKMNFKTDISEKEYLRESNYNTDEPLSSDILLEQEKINNADVIVFIYPIFWTEAPAKLVGWFNRVWTYGFAYGERKMKTLKKALFICSAGHTLEHLKQYGHLESMKTVMLEDRIFDRAKHKEMIILDGTTKGNLQLREDNWDKHLDKVYKVALSL